MVTTTRPTSLKAWAKAINRPPTEFGLTALPIISGAIPTGLRGSLYRNGPARLERGGERVGHWFDGDGAILSVHFMEARATATYRFVQTAGYQAEEKAGKWRFGGYGMTPPGPIWKRFTQGTKNAANTSVLALPDKLLALWEGGQPHALDLQTLETFGLDDLGLGHHLSSYSAHPKRDPNTGTIYNFGVAYGKNAQLHLYRSDRTGQIQQQAAIALQGLPLIHDFVLAAQYLVFFISPVRLNPLPVLVGLKSYSDALSWQPNKGTQILVVDRDTLEVVSRGEAQPWYQWHFGNGYLDSHGSVIVNLVRYEDFQTNQHLKEVATGQTQTAAKGTLWQVRLDPKSGKLTELAQLLDRSCEFPSVAPAQVGEFSRFTYLALHRRGVDIDQELLGAIARFDHQTGTLTEADLGRERYPMEPLYAADAENPQQGWVLTVVFDGNRDSSEVWIFDAEQLDAEPVCRLALPSVVPFGFHGTWQAA
ncbi:MAG TPA: carotenoid oxygenase family protein [Candidatus Caenarcaniphilales bacterium]